jgi:nitroreductase
MVAFTVMELFEALRTRRSVRVYEERPVPRELVEQVLDAARWAPSGANLQPWKFIVVTDPEKRKRIGAGAKFYFIKSHHVSEAPVLIVCLADVKKSRWAPVDVSMASQNLMLAAHALGLGTCFIGVFDEDVVRNECAIPDRYRIMGLITLGYPAHDERTPSRLPLSDIVAWETFAPESAQQRVRAATKSGPLSVFDKVAAMLLPFLRRRSSEKRSRKQ